MKIGDKLRVNIDGVENSCDIIGVTETQITTTSNCKSSTCIFPRYDVNGYLINLASYESIIGFCQIIDKIDDYGKVIILVDSYRNSIDCGKDDVYSSIRHLEVDSPKSYSWIIWFNPMMNGTRLMSWRCQTEEVRYKIVEEIKTKLLFKE